MIALIGAWTSLFACYLLLAGQVSPVEILAGAGAALAAVLWWVGIRRTSTHCFAFESDAWAAAGRACRGLPGATLSVAGILLRSLVTRKGGELAHWFLAPGRRADPHDGGRRAVGLLAASLASDSFVLRAPLHRDEIVVHVLGRSAPPKNPRWPV